MENFKKFFCGVRGMPPDLGEKLSSHEENLSGFGMPILKIIFHKEALKISFWDGGFKKIFRKFGEKSVGKIHFLFLTLSKKLSRGVRLIFLHFSSFSFSFLIFPIFQEGFRQ